MSAGLPAQMPETLYLYIDWLPTRACAVYLCLAFAVCTSVASCVRAYSRATCLHNPQHLFQNLYLLQRAPSERKASSMRRRILYTPFQPPLVLCFSIAKPFGQLRNIMHHVWAPLAAAAVNKRLRSKGRNACQDGKPCQSDCVSSMTSAAPSATTSLNSWPAAKAGIFATCIRQP